VCVEMCSPWPRHSSNEPSPIGAQDTGPSPASYGRSRGKFQGSWEVWPTHCRRVPPSAPEMPSTANDLRQQQPANMKLARALNPRATHGDTLVMCSSLVVSRPRAPRWRQPSCVPVSECSSRRSRSTLGDRAVGSGAPQQGPRFGGIELLQPGNCPVAQRFVAAIELGAEYGQRIG